ncbi:unnamed protein product [Symbiodinium natans]|uniref:Pentatricopeptide repeat-containing protein n=1 Tax=Symbiodinium natans TaxID=878477 RepID=A0A812SKF4_9DINO|nr:unnamed protein product [Symbiodinium natans]
MEQLLATRVLTCSLPDLRRSTSILNMRPQLAATQHIPETDRKRSFLWMLPLGSAVLALRSHSQPDQVPLSQRNRMLRRPRTDFASPTGRTRKRKRPHFLLTPSNPNVHATPGRTHEASSLRDSIKKCRRPHQLLKIFEEIRNAGALEASIFGSAMQRCGQGMWWDQLVYIYSMHRELGVSLHCIENNILLHALASCLKCKRTSVEAMEIRKQQALKLARGAWGCPPPTAVADFNCGLSSALRLCARIGSDAYAWADELWEWSEQQPLQKTYVTYAARMCLCEQRGQHASVADLLTQTMLQRLSPNEVVLGGLLEGAAASFNWKRADEIWHLLVHSHHVEANFLGYTAYAKAHLLAGRPQVSVEIIDAMLARDTCRMDYKLAVEYLQALLLVCHSSLAEADIQRLTTFLDEGATIIARESAQSGKKAWKTLASQASKMIADPGSVRFEDLLGTMNTRELSIMKDWQSCRAGSGYLKDGMSEKSRRA